MTMKGFKFLARMWAVLLMPVWAFSQEAVTLSPAEDAVIGWGRSAPAIQITAALQSGGQPVTKPRQFMTANLKDEQGKLIDRVPLYDDGTHSDQNADDGIFTSVYRPPNPGAFRLQARAQWQEGSKSREAWSKQSDFKVEYIPYPHIVYPEPGGKVGMNATLRARLLLNGQPYDTEDVSLNAKAWTIASGGSDREVQSSDSVVRRGSLLVASLDFAERGPHEVNLTVSVDRGGMTLQSEPALCQVEVATPPTLLLWIGALFVCSAFVLVKKPVPLYSHKISVRNADSDEKVGSIEIKPNKLEAVKHTVGGDGSDTPIEGVSGILCELVTNPGEKVIKAVSRNSGMLSVNGNAQSSAILRSATEKFTVGGYEFELQASIASGSHSFSRFVFTPIKLILLVIGLTTLAVGFWQYKRFFEL